MDFLFQRFISVELFGHRVDVLGKSEFSVIDPEEVFLEAVEDPSERLSLFVVISDSCLEIDDGRELQLLEDLIFVHFRLLFFLNVTDQRNIGLHHLGRISKEFLTRAKAWFPIELICRIGADCS